MPKLSKTQIDKLGERLRAGHLQERDLRLLEEYRLGFSEAYEFVVSNLKESLNLSPTGRLAKSTPSIIGKLQRESIRLTQIQDIAGCRVVVRGIEEQNQTISEIEDLFKIAHKVDRRERPSHGYRAVHEIVKYQHHLVEIQIRTYLQHLWAEFSEKMSDRFGAQLKYGVGDDEHLRRLQTLTDLVASQENLEARWSEYRARLSRVVENAKLPEDSINEFRASESEVARKFATSQEFLEKYLENVIEQSSGGIG